MKSHPRERRRIPYFKLVVRWSWQIYSQSVAVLYSTALLQYTDISDVLNSSRYFLLLCPTPPETRNLAETSIPREGVLYSIYVCKELGQTHPKGCPTIKKGRTNNRLTLMEKQVRNYDVTQELSITKTRD